MPRRRSAPPLWFLVALAALVAAIGHVCGLHTIEHTGVSVAWFGWLITIGSWIWAGVQAGTTVTVSFLSWAVGALWATLSGVYNVLIEVSGAAMKGLRAGWQFFRDTYEHVLKPAWQKLWKLVDTVRRTLERVLAPVFKVLRAVRQWVLDFYAAYVRPILDAIGVARRVLRVLSSLGLEWARKLDEQLGRLEERINAPFLFALRKINEVINIVNRVVTANGLFQRLALIRSLERDIKYAQRAFVNAFINRPTDEERAAMLSAQPFKTGEQIIAETRAYLDTGDGPHAGTLDEWSQDLAIRMSRP